MAQPMYQWIAEQLRQRIESGELPPGAQLPTELELRETYSASRNTVRDAIRRLISQNLVETKPGQGTFVVQPITPFVTTLTGKPHSADSAVEGARMLDEVNAAHRKPRVSTPRVEVLECPSNVSPRLRIAPGTEVVSRHQELYIDETPWALQTTYYPKWYVEKAPDLLTAKDMPDGVVRYLEETLSIKQAGYRDWVTARTPRHGEQAFFRIPHDSTVFEIFRTGFDQTGTPMRVTVTVYPADRNQFIVNVGDVPPPRYDVETAHETRE